MTFQEQNEATLLNLWKVGEEMLHRGTVISDLERIVDKYVPENCSECGGYGEVSSRGDFSDNVEVEICKKCKGTGVV